MVLLHIISKVCKAQTLNPQKSTPIPSQPTLSKICKLYISTAKPPASRLIPTIEKAQSIIGYKFTNSQLLWKAFQAPDSLLRSGSDETAGLRTVRFSVEFDRFPGGHKSLALLGDTVLKLVLVEIWYKMDCKRKTGNIEAWPNERGLPKVQATLVAFSKRLAQTHISIYWSLSWP